MFAADPHSDQPVLRAGEALESATSAMILLHGRGAGADDILPLADQIGADGMVYLAPQAAGSTWYPFSFLMPIDQNEPFLSSALATVGRLVSTVEDAGIPLERIVLAGFSQGACLACEFAARNAARYGAVLGFSGGLIGADETPRDYSGSLSGTPVFLGCSDIDPHIPLARVETTAEIMDRLGGSVDKRIYPGMAHTINRDEIAAASLIVHSISSDDGQ
ncbi:dienelactone hydrolase family protein [soil metagenome]